MQAAKREPSVLLVAGSRGFQAWEQGYINGFIERGISSLDLVKPFTVLHGGAPGIDRMAGKWAESRLIPVEVMPAQWDLFGKSAGYKRNAEMVDRADCVIIIWDGQSKGTRHTMKLTIDAELPFVLISRDATDSRYWAPRFL